MNIVNYIKVFNCYPIRYNKCRVSVVKFKFITTVTVCVEIIILIFNCVHFYDLLIMFFFRIHSLSKNFDY